MKLQEKWSKLAKISDNNENNINRKVNLINDKIDQRQTIKEKCIIVDDKVAERAQASGPELELQLRKLHDLMQRKQELLDNVDSFNSSNPVDSDIIEFKAILTELEVDASNLRILKDRNVIIGKKKQMLKYLTNLLKDAEGRKRKVVRVLGQTPVYKDPEIKTGSGKNKFSDSINQLKYTLQEHINEHQFLEGDIDRLNKELEYFNQNQDPNKTKRETMRTNLSSLNSKVNNNKSKLYDAVRGLLSVNQDEFCKVQEAKTLEAKLALTGENGLENQRKYLLDLLDKLRKRIEYLIAHKSDADLSDIRSELAQKQRIIVQLVNLLRNLDDKILYVKSNQATYTKPAVAETHTTTYVYNSPIKYRVCSYHDQEYLDTFNTTIVDSHPLYLSSYDVFIPSDEEVKNLVPKELYAQVKRLSQYTFEYNGKANNRFELYLIFTNI